MIAARQSAQRGAMPERREPEFDPDAAVRAVAEGLPDIETPVIDIQDLARNPKPDTRVNNSGVKVPPPSTEEAIAELEEEFRKHPPV